MGLIPYKNKFKFFMPSTAFVIIVAAAAIASILFSFRLQLASSSIQKISDGLKDEVTYLSYSRELEALSMNQPLPEPTITYSQKEEVWGVAEQIGETTWTMKIGEDERMATPVELQAALNSYRNKKGVGSLEWDEKLADLARKRTDTFIELGKLDEHAGFMAYVEEDGNMEGLGFWGVGENSSIGFKLEGVHLIEWIFAGDPPHDNNQLDASWTHVGIGIKGTAVDVIFGKK